MTVSLPVGGSTVPTACLLKELKPALAEKMRTTVVGIDRRPSRYATSAQIEDVGVVLGDGRRLSMLFKNLSPGTMLSEARRTRPTFAHQPQREIQMYGRILTRARLGTPRFFGAYIDAALDRYWLFIEKVSGVELYQIGDREIWAQTARWLAAMHQRLAASVTDAESLSAPPVHYNADWYRRWLHRAERFAPRAAGSAMRRLSDAHEDMIDHLAALPKTLIHGDLHASNVLICRRPQELRICAVDWERASIAPGPMDLATLTVGWDDQSADRLIRAYAAAQGEPSTSLSDLRLTHAFCRLHLCIQWLGWAEDWKPAEHRRDRLQEALQLTDELGL